MNAQCRRCDGAGKRKVGNVTEGGRRVMGLRVVIDCPDCDNTGVRPVCRACDGDGVNAGRECDHCDGEGAL